MGSLQDLPHVDIMSPITKFAASVPHTERVADMVSMAFREAVNGAPGPSYLEIPRDMLDAKVPLERARIPQAGRLSRVDQIGRRSRRHRKARRHSRQLGTTLRAVRHAGVDFARSRCRGGALPRAQHARLHERFRAAAFSRRAIRMGLTARAAPPSTRPT